MKRAENCLIIPLLVLFSFSFAGDANLNDYIVHRVKKGESVSLICIDYYGYYSKELGSAFLKDNPLVTDINVILAGQMLRFRTPKSAAQKTAVPKAPAAAEDTLFVKKIASQQGVVTCVTGDAALFRKGSKQGEPLAVNTIVSTGDRIKTGADGRVEIIINRETVVRMKEKTDLYLEAYRNAGNDNGRTKVGFSLGTLWTKMKKFQDKVSRFELELPTAIAGVHGTVYQSVVSADSSAEVKVFSGEVAVKGRGAARSGETAAMPAGRREVQGPSEVEGPKEVDMDTWIRIVRDMQKITIDKKGKASIPRNFAADTANEWEQWNRERDSRINEMFGEERQ